MEAILQKSVGQPAGKIGRRGGQEAASIAPKLPLDKTASERLRRCVKVGENVAACQYQAARVVELVDIRDLSD